MKKRPRHELPMIPTANMVDIAIILIIFYIVCANFIAQQTGKVKLPSSPHIDTLKEPLVMVSIDEAGVISVQGKPVNNVSEVEGRVASAGIRPEAATEKRRVLVRVDGEIKQNVFGPVLEAVVQAGGIVSAVGEKRTAAPSP